MTRTQLIVAISRLQRKWVFKSLPVHGKLILK